MNLYRNHSMIIFPVEETVECDLLERFYFDLVWIFLTGLTLVIFFTTVTLMLRVFYARKM